MGKGTLSHKQAQEMIDAADQDGNGTVDFDEFLAFASAKVKTAKGD